MMQPTANQVTAHCFHCGETCSSGILYDHKTFCCAGCKTVYGLLNQHQLTDYYCLNKVPGITVQPTNSAKFAALDEADIEKRLISFKDKHQTQVTFYLPQIHCSSCLWLLENLDKLHPGIIASQVAFIQKKVSISFSHNLIGLRGVAELLAQVGYEPHISMQDADDHQPKQASQHTALKLGITGFCFANIMLISFPEYLGLSYTQDALLSSFFRYANVLLALPVLLFGAKEFFINAFNSIRQKQLNIDAPIALAITVTFCRSIYEIGSQTGAGYLDSMSGIVFFMLIGRALQNRTSQSLRFNRDYKSYFPITVSVCTNGCQQSKKIQEVQEGDLLLMHHLEIVPVDGILSKGKACIDYSFVTGESIATNVDIGELVYAGGKVISGEIELLAVKPFSQSSFTQLWNNDVFKKEKAAPTSFVTIISKYFSFFILFIALASFVFWQWRDAQHAWNAFTAVLIVACPCSLLLSSSFVYGFVMEVFANSGFFVKNTATIEALANIDHIVFDKTGTLTAPNSASLQYEGTKLSMAEGDIFISMLHCSQHPVGKAVVSCFQHFEATELEHYKEVAGSGVEAWVNDKHYKAGNAAFVHAQELPTESVGSKVYLSIDGQVLGCYMVENKIKEHVPALLHSLRGYGTSLLSGDNSHAQTQMQQVFPPNATLLFQQSPQQKLAYVAALQQQGKRVLMVGDGFNDAGALQQSQVGIAVVHDVFSFSPACDAIMEEKQIASLGAFIRGSKVAKKCIVWLFVYSILYNIVGISFAISAHLQPMVAAILMPLSSLSIILFAYVGAKYGVERRKTITTCSVPA